MIHRAPHQKGDKMARGKIICFNCAREAPYPTPESDLWFACWCKDPDRCRQCGECPVCFEESKGVV